ncbi:MAG: glutamate synthase subunit alpha, partial [Candidatus Dormibacteraeota bacterium]|nr:glutamate synthase subunit alpha [Candidatus Dormibacteraeota bacterium]
MSAPHTAMGLYDPSFDHDGCGVGFVARVGRPPAHDVVALGIEALINLGHRGASGSDPDSGDGAGILLQLPDAFLRGAASFDLPALGTYGVGVVFMPPDDVERLRSERIVAEACADEGLRVVGWRDVPHCADAVGHTARAMMPAIRQVFVAAIGLRGEMLERRLYVLRRVIERRAAAAGLGRARLHLASLSSRTLIYKGMLTAAQLPRFYPELGDASMVSSLALVHARFSTNVLPRWDLAQPFRMSAHNGEINTLRGNVNWMRARQSKFKSPHFGDDIAKLRPLLDETGSDSSQFDEALELLSMTGRSVEHAVMMMIPEAWEQHTLMDDSRRAFYEYHAAMMEP